ncbi:hypothetical protein BKP45_08730 [Anaerobacillus alkalidiazotrophicus]|uniref:Prolow-density lipoprotein receptor-related protein 1-like beta-propeller domain-containing protein n=1 Tax=Anaerobacillus alkalidiazotrophicus TaxID=472963 RepID=A0A1S2M7U3_9BACI|nr:DUF5050 domain-containing protein [Anaerobacillus alkalidiazotrophicus]OIJ20560.1 hypothetical protein BKP45_08730 [Anaerobacillus alkalidiazotrophicus]
MRNKFFLIVMLLLIVLSMIACSGEKTAIDEEDLNLVEEEQSNGDIENEKSGREELGEEDKRIVEEVADNNVVEINRGNHSGNILMGGNVEYSNGWLYFANIFDDNRLYKMTVEGNEVTKLTEEAVSNIHVINNETIYYVTTEMDFGSYRSGNSIRRMSISGEAEEILFEGYVSLMHVYGDELVFLHGESSEYTSIHTLSMTDQTLTDWEVWGYGLSMDKDEYIIIGAGEIYYGSLDQIGQYHGLGYIVGNDYALFQDGTIIARDLKKYSDTTEKDLRYISLNEMYTEKPVQYFNAIGDDIYFSAALAGVDQNTYLYNLKEYTLLDLNEVLYEIYTFEDYVVGYYARQGGGAYIVIDRETNEGRSIYP